MDAPEIPKDVRMNMADIHMAFLDQQYKELKKMFILHETELILLWLSIFAIMGVTTYRNHKVLQQLKELT